ncbi:transmembrane protein -like [Brachionus plicatilis]|uniref:GDT1 family protein n=1 Tax=Brachionus plicatilis TaxID=10195 RepID=A0A3M7T2Q3_BRAPC|nr:transmembrane protein -like [Brachionus plicatilis]
MGIKSKKILVFILLIVIVVDNAVRINCSETNTEKKEDSVLKDKSSESEEKHEKNSQEIKFRSKDAGPSFGFIHAFFASFSVILVSEIGDKTFFIAAIMAMKHPRMTVYSGAMLALGLMTLLSALLGNILTKVIPRVYTYYASSVLFGLFGLKMLREGWQMDNSDASDEYDEANEELKESEEKDKNLETGGEEDKNPTRKFVQMFRKYMSPVFLQAFVLTFLAEWGDRSQISTIILGARENMFGTVLGGTLGHGICTGLAVIGGRMISQRISVRTVTLVGAFVFLFFAFSAFFIGPDAY